MANGADEAAKKSHENMLFRIASKIGQSLLDVRPAIIDATLKQLDNSMKPPKKDHWEKWCDKLVTDGFCDQDTADILKPLADYPFPFGGIFYLLTVLKTTMGDLEAALEIYMMDRQYDLLRKTTPHPAPVENLVRSMIIDPKRSNENRAELKRHGFSDDQIDNIILSHYQMLDVDTVKTNYLRGNISEDLMYERLRELGLTDTRIQEIVKTWRVIPGAGDLLTMYAKEAFEPDIYKKIGLDAEFPTEGVPFFEAQGIDVEWVKRYWYAHWAQPSIGQGFEMLHRGVIDTDILDLLFRAVEIPPFWRDKLTKIAYQPLTRVDVRRMHALGVITTDKLIQSYLNIGYNADDALAMANFTIQYNTGNDSSVTRSTILSTFEEGLISRQEALDMLLAQDYDEDTAEFYLTRAEYDRDKALTDAYIDAIKERFLLNIINETELRDALNKINMQGEMIELYIDAWKLDSYKYAALPSKSDLEAFLTAGIITESQYRTVMTRLGYESTHISWYLKYMEREIDAPNKLPSRTDINKWYQEKIISEADWRGYMWHLGYGDVEIARYFKQIK